MKRIPYEPLEPRRAASPLEGGWSQKIEFDGGVFYVSVSRGRRVRIPFKPRGENVGYWWYPHMVPERGRDLFNGSITCGKTHGVAGILEYAVKNRMYAPVTLKVIGWVKYANELTKLEEVYEQS